MTVRLNKPAVWDPLPNFSDILWNTKVGIHHQFLNLSGPRTWSLVHLSKWRPTDVSWTRFSSVGKKLFLPVAYNITVVWVGVVMLLCPPHLQTSQRQPTQPFQAGSSHLTQRAGWQRHQLTTHNWPVCNSMLSSLTLFMKNFTFLSDKYGIFTGNLLFPKLQDI